MNQLKLIPQDTGLVLIDLQEKLAAAMPEGELHRAIRRWTTLAEIAGRLRLPIAVSEQYPRGLGRTLPLLREILGKVTPPPRFVDKLDFSCCAVPLFEQFILESGRRTWIVAGMETHVCVFQTVRDLLLRNLHVQVVADGVLSRHETDWRIGLDMIARTGALVTSTETAMFDLVGRAEGETFKALSRLVKNQ